jgi:hypothetical protein
MGQPKMAPEIPSSLGEGTRTVEFRAREAGGMGTWHAEWLLGTNCQQSNVSDPNVPVCAWPN